jgi:uncharacterized protein (TIGR03000 family)
MPAPKGQAMPPAADGSTTPRSEVERDAVRKLLQDLRKKKGPPIDEEAAAPATEPQQAPKAALPARLTITLPADARLWVDQVECPLTSSQRTFSTPVLQPGQTYYYTLKMQVQRQGAPVSDSQRVLVTSGQQVNVLFHEPEPITTAQR